MKKKVNLGSGTDYLKGWINVDVEPFYHPDIIADLHKPFPFEDDSIDEIKASDILEHFTKEDGERFLRECYRVLKPSGALFLRSHSIDDIFRKFHHDPDVLVHFLYGNTAVTGIFGAHKFAYTREYLQYVLRKIGFSLSMFAIEDTNFIARAKKSTPPTFSSAKICLINAQNLSPIEKTMWSKRKNTELLTLPATVRSVHDIVSLPQTIVTLSRALFRSETKPDLVLVSGAGEKIVASLCARIAGIPIIWLESDPKHTQLCANTTLSKLIYRLSHRLPDSVVLTTKDHSVEYMKHTRISLSKIAVMDSSTASKSKRPPSLAALTARMQEICIDTLMWCVQS